MKFAALFVTVALAAAPVASAVAQPAPQSAQLVTTLTLLGTAGGPGGKTERAGIASLVSVGGKRYLVDAGEGVSRQLARAGLSERDLSVIFFTHLHDDHTAGLPSLMSFFFTTSRGGSMSLIGPPGVQGLLRGVLAYLQPNAVIRRTENPKLRAPEAMFSAKEVAPGVIYADGDVRVTAVENTHYRLSAKAFGEHQRSYALKFETADKTIVFTGDTGDSTAVEGLAKGADILVSEMASPGDLSQVPPDVRAHMIDEHLSPSQVGQLAAKAGVKMLVLSHIQKVSDENLAEIRRHYKGPVLVGQDLDRL